MPNSRRRPVFHLPSIHPPGGRGRLAATFALLALFIPAWTVAATEIALTGPRNPTWKDEVVVRVTGTVPPGCGVSLGDPHQSLVGGKVRIDLPMSVDCTLPLGADIPFTIDENLGQLAPGDYVVAVGAGGAPDDEVELVVYEAGLVELVLPELARSDVPVELAVRGYWSCPSVEGVEVVGNVLRMKAFADCQILPPGRSLSAAEPETQPGLLAPGVYEVVVEDWAMLPFGSDPPAIVRGTLRVWDAAGCVPSDTTLCLGGGRFRVTATWADFSGGTGVGRAVPLAGNETSGLMWFFGPDNNELSVKVLNGCSSNDRWWVFLSPATTVAFTVTVTDTRTGVERRFTNPSGVASPLLANTSAFACP